MTADEAYRDVVGALHRQKPRASKAVCRLGALFLLLKQQPGIFWALCYTRSMLRMHEDNADGIDPFLSCGMQYFPDHPKGADRARVFTAFMARTGGRRAQVRVTCL